MLRSVALVVALLLVAPSLAAAAPDDRAAQAQLRYESGMAHFNLQEWDAAIADWQEGYRIKPVPEFLFNIAQAYRKSGRPDKALFFYERYLSLAPNAADRDDVERQVAAMRQQIAARAAAPPTTTPASSQPTPIPSSTTSTSGKTSPGAALTAKAPARKTPVYKKAWFWGTLGTVAVVAAGGVVLGVTLAGSHPQTLDAVVY